jgi:hypothetical protein
MLFFILAKCHDHDVDINTDFLMHHIQSFISQHSGILVFLSACPGTFYVVIKQNTAQHHNSANILCANSAYK